MNEITVFQSEQFGSVRMLEENGKVLFCGKDCAEALGYNNARNAINEHCPHALKRGVGVRTGQKADGSPAIQQVEMAFIPEGDLYRLITHSRLPAAQEFEHWVFDEVLPSIRKTGGYMPDMSRIIAETVRATIREILPLLNGQNAPDTALPDAPKRRRLKPPISIIGTLDVELKQVVEDMLCSGKYTYTEIGRIMRDTYGIQVSKSSIARYASHLYMEQVAP